MFILDYTTKYKQMKKSNPSNRIIDYVRAEADLEYGEKNRQPSSQHATSFYTFTIDKKTCLFSGS